MNPEPWEPQISLRTPGCFWLRLGTTAEHQHTSSTTGLKTQQLHKPTNCTSFPYYVCICVLVSGRLALEITCSI